MTSTPAGAPSDHRRRSPAPRIRVVRPDGRRAKIPRLRGQLLVCALGCCCGRTEDGHPAVPADVYHAEWERRGLRDVVHLTIGGCLGPCALANVALLLLDGRALGLHSMNRPELVLALYDHLDALLREGPDRSLPAVLAPLAFPPFAWDVEDRHRRSGDPRDRI